MADLTPYFNSCHCVVHRNPDCPARASQVGETCETGSIQSFLIVPVVHDSSAAVVHLLAALDSLRLHAGLPILEGLLRADVSPCGHTSPLWGTRSRLSHTYAEAEAPAGDPMAQSLGCRTRWASSSWWRGRDGASQTETATRPRTPDRPRPSTRRPGWRTWTAAAEQWTDRGTPHLLPDSPPRRCWSPYRQCSTYHGATTSRDFQSAICCSMVA